MELPGLRLQALVQPSCVGSVPELACSSGVYASRRFQYSARQVEIIKWATNRLLIILLLLSTSYHHESLPFLLLFLVLFLSLLL